jgi:isoquinoline 1-oxidoreductase beta subunit
MNKWTRRALITAGSLAGGGLVLGVGGLMLAPNRFAIGRGSAAGQHALTTWLTIDTAGAIRVIVPHAELGQGAQTALAMMLVEELDGDWSRVTVEEAPAVSEFANGHLLAAFLPVGRLPGFTRKATDFLAYRETRNRGFQATGGSASVRATGYYGLRIAGASARQMLLQAAAQRFGVAADECRVSSSVISHADGHTATFGELAADAAKLTPPTNPPLKKAADYRLVGQPQRRFDVPAKVDGSARFGIDAQVEGMVFAAIRAAPVFGAKLTNCDPAPALALPGVERVVPLDNAVAVVATSWHRARRALESLQPVFTVDARNQMDSASYRRAQLALLATGQLESVVKRGDPGNILDGAAGKKLAATFELPYLAHATLEPMNATARFAGGKLDIWTSVQDPLNAAQVAADALGIERDQVTVHHGLVGGGFGRRLPGQHDFVLQAVRLARELTPRPVKLVWSREEDMTHGYYRGTVCADMQAALADDGSVLAWRSRCTSSSEAGAANPPYDIDAVELQFTSVPSHVRQGPWRSVGHSQHGFIVEAFVDELAAAAGVDPYQYRRRLLAKEPRLLAVLDKVAAMANWQQPLPKDRARGIAIVRSFGSIVAEVAEIEVIRNAEGQPSDLRVPRVFAAVDCGLLVNPLTGAEQIEGGVVFGLSAALDEAITIGEGAVQQTNFHQYPLLRLPDAPAVEVAFIASTERPGGLGEPGTPPIAAAVANAWFAATGQRLRSLPLRPAIAAANKQT